MRNILSRASRRTRINGRILGAGCCAVGLAIIAVAASARTWTVEADGSGDAPNIQAAIDLAAGGDTVLVSPGVYRENLFTLDKMLILRSRSGPAATVLDGGNHARVVRFRGGGLLEGFTIMNGWHASSGAGVSVEGSVATTIRNNLIQHNVVGDIKSGRGGGIYLDPATRGAVVEENEIRANAAGDEGGGLLDDSVFSTPPHNILRRNTVRENRAGIAGGGMKLRHAMAIDNIIVANSARYFGGGLYTTGRALVRNNTVVANQTENSFANGAGIHACGAATINANVVAYNHSEDVVGGAGVGIYCCNVSDVSCNDSWSNDQDYICSTLPGTNFSADPQFCDLKQGDYTLRASSPCAAHEECGLIGALGVNCGSVRVATIHWGSVKALYR